MATLPSVWVLIVASLLLQSTVSAFKFRVGGEKGWTEPHGDAAENYNHWASQIRFQVGDSLYFKYENDSLLEVTKEDYKRCYTANPLRKFASGITTVTLDRSGLFFFISGEPGHCEAGQRLIVRVASQPDQRGIAPSPALSPYSDPAVVSSAAWVPAGAITVALSAVLCYFMLH
ncbi:mavicyanin-like [Curcuma longa]|uniref:mavicyanin-like n=1 Tax=Curcuma longa TaxID=136217 RepID=UPI003D9E8129